MFKIYFSDNDYSKSEILLFIVKNISRSLIANIENLLKIIC